MPRSATAAARLQLQHLFHRRWHTYRCSPDWGFPGLLQPPQAHTRCRRRGRRGSCPATPLPASATFRATMQHAQLRLCNRGGPQASWVANPSPDPHSHPKLTPRPDQAHWAACASPATCRCTSARRHASSWSRALVSSGRRGRPGASTPSATSRARARSGGPRAMSRPRPACPGQCPEGPQGPTDWPSLAPKLGAAFSCPLGVPDACHVETRGRAARQS